MARNPRYALGGIVLLTSLAAIVLATTYLRSVACRDDSSAGWAGACSIARLLGLASDPPKQAAEQEAHVSCSACPLRLALLDKSPAPQGYEFQVAIEFSPEPSWPLPNVADLRVATSTEIELVEVKLGEALREANARLVPNSSTGKPWRKTDAGAYQFILLPASQPKPIHGGQLLHLRFRATQPESVALWIEKRRHKFAPMEAEDVLETTPYDGKVTVLPP